MVKESLPISLVVGPGMSMMQALQRSNGWNESQVWRGRPRTRPGEVAGDSAYDTRDLRAYLRRRGIKANMPVNVRNGRRPRHGRPYRLDSRNI
jgi:hypothetical protein